MDLVAIMVDSDEVHGDAAHDLLNNKFYAQLLQRAQSGEFLAIIAAPPCSTFSVARHFRPGPPPVRNRQHPRGIPNQNPVRAKEAERANLLITRTCAILTAAINTGSEFILENPADHGDPSNSYCFVHREHCPLWQADEIKTLKRLSSAQEITFPLCALGHDYQKLTITLLCTPRLAASLRHLSKLRCNHVSHKQVGGINEDGKFTSGAAARYPAKLNLILAQSVAGLRETKYDEMDSS